MTRCVIYCRVSTDAQERDGTSLQTQQAACQEYALAHNWTVVTEIRDSSSGFTLERPGMERVRGMLRDASADVILAFAVDRLSRNQNHIGVLFDEAHQSGVKLDFATEKFEDTAVGRFILAARAFVAEVEREKIVERTLRGKAQRARSGKLPQATGRGFYGYRYDAASGTRSVESREAGVVREVFETFTGGGSCHRIASALNRRGVPAFSGGRWYPLTVRRMLLNEAYTGRTVYRRMKAEKYRDPRSGHRKVRILERGQDEWIEIEGATPAIISRDIYLRAKAILEDPERRNRSRPSRIYALTGRLRCAVCGTPMVGQALMKGRYAYYRCRSRYVAWPDSTCPAKYIRSDALESRVRGALLDVLADPARVLAEAERLASAVSQTDELTGISESLKDVEAKQRRLVRLFTDGELPPEILEEQRRDLSKRRSALEAERSRLESLMAPVLDIAKLKRSLPVAVRQIRQ